MSNTTPCKFTLLPPPASVTPPTRWGAEDHLEALFRAHATNVRVTPREFAFRYKSPQHWLQVFRDFYGPTHKAFAALTTDGQQALEDDILMLIGLCNRATDGTVVIPSEYVEVVIDRR